MKLGLKRGTVELEPHDERWRLEAEKAISVLKKVLGEEQHSGAGRAAGGSCAQCAQRLSLFD